MRQNFWGELIVQLRVEQSLSQRALAQEAGVCRSTLRRIEAGQTAGEMDMMERIFGCLGYELEALETVGGADRERKRFRSSEAEQGDRSRIAARKVLNMRTSLTSGKYRVT